MTKTELFELIANGEGSGVEFKRDDVRPEQLAKEIVALANFQGGIILLGVEDDGTIAGIQREQPGGVGDGYGLRALRAPDDPALLRDGAGG